MKKLPQIFALQCYAIVLAVLHMPQGVLTDEAKYLLNIPYPHPPFARTIFSLTEWMPIQEVFWRIVLATFVVQSIWFVRSMARQFTREQQYSVAIAWLLSAAILLQAGTIMMAPLTAVQALFFCWAYTQRVFVEKYAAYIALFWLICLFTAYQILLFLPVVIAVFWRTALPRVRVIFCITVPVLLLVLYTASNPFISASMFAAGTQNAAHSFAQRFEYVLLLWALGGSIVLSVVGTFGAVLKKRWDILLSLALVSVYVFLSYRQYYAVLFTPLFIAGSVAAPRLLQGTKMRFVLYGICSAIFVQLYQPSMQPTLARQVGIMLQNVQGTVLIHGSYGHQWQYELTQPIRQYNSERAGNATAIVCLDACEEVPEDFNPVMVRGINLWLKN